MGNLPKPKQWLYFVCSLLYVKALPLKLREKGFTYIGGQTKKSGVVVHYA